jgi:hypothetical protein
MLGRCMAILDRYAVLAGPMLSPSCTWEPGLALQVAPALRDLLAETVLPPRPSTASVAHPWAQVRAFIGVLSPSRPAARRPPAR